MANTQFEKVVTVAGHANYGAFRAEDKKFYKPSGEGLTLENFEIGKTYKVSGYTSETGKTSYITMSSPTEEKPSAPVAEPAKPAGRRVAKPQTEEKTDWVKIAKGKTYSLIVAGLAHSDFALNTPEGRKALLEAADALIRGIEDRKYF